MILFFWSVLAHFLIVNKTSQMWNENYVGSIGAEAYKLRKSLLRMGFRWVAKQIKFQSWRKLFISCKRGVSMPGTLRLSINLTAVKREKFVKVKQSTSKLRLLF